VRDLWRARHQQHDRHGQNRSRTYRCSSQRHLVRRADHIEQFVQHLVIRRLSRPDAVDLLIKPADKLGLHAAQIEISDLGHPAAAISACSYR
jgi:hypothetical protein